MLVRIRLKRVGSRKRPFYRIVVMASRKPRDGRPIEEIGYYSAVLPGDDQVKIKSDRVEYWMSQGACMSNTVRGLVRRVARASASADVSSPDV